MRNAQISKPFPTRRLWIVLLFSACSLCGLVSLRQFQVRALRSPEGPVAATFRKLSAVRGGRVLGAQLFHLRVRSLPIHLPGLDAEWPVSELSIAPNLRDCVPFLVFCTITGICALCLARIQILTSRIHAEQRASERVRIARDLHDTLLQGIQGLILKLDYATKNLPESSPVRKTLESGLASADQMLLEFRERVKQLRSEDYETEDLARSLAQVGADLNWNNSVQFSVVVKGESVTLQCSTRDELLYIGREAIANAFHHAKPTAIEVEIHYDRAALRLICRDNGAGLDPASLNNRSMDDHWGLVGMRERAHSLGGELQVWGAHGGGTEVVTTIPARRAYLHYKSSVLTYLSE